MIENNAMNNMTAHKTKISPETTIHKARKGSNTLAKWASFFSIVPAAATKTVSGYLMTADFGYGSSIVVQNATQSVVQGGADYCGGGTITQGLYTVGKMIVSCSNGTIYEATNAGYYPNPSPDLRSLTNCMTEYVCPQSFNDSWDLRFAALGGGFTLLAFGGLTAFCAYQHRETIKAGVIKVCNGVAGFFANKSNPDSSELAEQGELTKLVPGDPYKKKSFICC